MKGPRPVRGNGAPTGWVKAPRRQSAGAYVAWTNGGEFGRAGVHGQAKRSSPEQVGQRPPWGHPGLGGDSFVMICAEAARLPRFTSLSGVFACDSKKTSKPGPWPGFFFLCAQATAGCIRCCPSSTYSRCLSPQIQRRPVSSAARAVVKEPANGSTTSSPGGQKNSTNKRASFRGMTAPWRGRPSASVLARSARCDGQLWETLSTLR